ncbi:hypothetical protein CRG98_019266 [Punica granatum]|uniref:Uncharacterized protein n=1 Tax=Punica granatum TaxID=22663 RepID=A0A2I0JWS8_PUNGR|nr:hypothetical protein CRG98_019266 [Punica granatum]
MGNSKELFEKFLQATRSRFSGLSIRIHPTPGRSSNAGDGGGIQTDRPTDDRRYMIRGIYLYIKYYYGLDGLGGGNVPVAAGVFVEAAAGGEDDEADVDVAEDGELPALLDEPVPALRERHLPAVLVLDPLQLHLAPPRPPPFRPRRRSRLPGGRVGGGGSWSGEDGVVGGWWFRFIAAMGERASEGVRGRVGTEKGAGLSPSALLPKALFVEGDLVMSWVGAPLLANPPPIEVIDVVRAYRRPRIRGGSCRGRPFPRFKRSRRRPHDPTIQFKVVGGL